MFRFVVRTSTAALLFLLCAALGFGVASWFAPERLRDYTESRLSELLQTGVQLRRVQLGLGLGVELIGEEGRLWVDPYGAQLYVHRVVATLETGALLRGQFQLSRLLLDGARLRIRRDADGELSPPPFRELARGDTARKPAPSEAWLRPIEGLEGVSRFLLSRPLVADVLELRDSAILFSDEFPPGRGARRRRTAAADISLEHLQARLEGAGPGGPGRLRLSGRLFRGDRPFGRVEWVGSGAPTGPLALEVATTALDLAEVEPYLAPGSPRARLSGLLTGVLALEARDAGRQRVELDVLLSEFQGDLGRDVKLAPLQSDRVAARFELEVSPQRVTVEHARITSGELDLQLAGDVARPIRESSEAQLSASFREVQLARALQQAGLLPLYGEPGAGSRAEAGTLRQLTARGRSSLGHWRDFLSGRDERAPADFSVEAELVDGRLRLDSGQILESMSGQVRWSGDHAELHGARASLDGKPLPILDVELDGVSHLLATPEDRRRLFSRADRLLGMRTLWAILKPEDPEAAHREPPRIQVAIDHLDHPAVLWPLQDVKAEIHPLEHGFRADVKQALWAGAPASGTVEWQFEPEEQLRLAVKLEAPLAELPPRENPESWAVGRFFVGGIDSPRWKQQQATGRFQVTGAALALDDISVLLVPRGSLSGSARLDLTSAEALPADLDLALSNADVGALAEQVGVAPGAISGTLAMKGHLMGSLQSHQSFFADLSGPLELRATDGRIRRGLPPIVAIALANETLNPFKRRKSLRYTKIESHLELQKGLSRTRGFGIDGPDVRMFASGSLDIAREPHALDADVAVFLFRQVDRVVEQIPLLNALLLGNDDSIMAAYYKVEGPWDGPHASLVPLRTLTSSGPVGILIDGLPHFVQRSFDALSEMLGRPIPPPELEGAPEPGRNLGGAASEGSRGAAEAAARGRS